MSDIFFYISPSFCVAVISSKENKSESNGNKEIVENNNKRHKIVYTQNIYSVIFILIVIALAQ